MSKMRSEIIFNLTHPMFMTYTLFMEQRLASAYYSRCVFMYKIEVRILTEIQEVVDNNAVTSCNNYLFILSHPIRLFNWK